MSHWTPALGNPVANVWTDDGEVHIKIDFGEFVVNQSGTFQTEDEAQAAVDLAMETLEEFAKASVMLMGEPSTRLQ